MKYSMKYLPMSNEICNEITAMDNEILNEIPANEQWNIWWNKCHGERNIQWNTHQLAMKYSMKYLPMSNEIINQIAAMENEIFTIEQWNIQWNWQGSWMKQVPQWKCISFIRGS